MVTDVCTIHQGSHLDLAFTMTTQTEVQVDTHLERPERVLRLSSSSTRGRSGIENGSIRSRSATGIERMELGGPDQAPEGATVFTTPNAMAVKGQLFSAYFALFVAGMNGRPTMLEKSSSLPS